LLKIKRRKQNKVMKKYIISVILILFVQMSVICCPVCERNQIKALRGIIHGSGPESNWDYVGVVAIGILVVFTLIYTIKWLIRPGEKDTSHIKYSILK